MNSTIKYMILYPDTNKDNPSQGSSRIFFNGGGGKHDMTIAELKGGGL